MNDEAGVLGPYEGFRLTIAVTRLNEGCEAVSRSSSPVMTERHRLLKPFIVLVTGSVMVHASQPSVKAEHTPDAYSLILMFRERRWSVHI